MIEKTPTNYMLFLRASRGRSGKDFQEWYLDSFAPRLQRSQAALGRHVVNLAEQGPEELRLSYDSTDPADRYDVVAEMSWREHRFAAALKSIQAQLNPWADIQHAYRVSGAVILDREGPSAEALPGYKLLRELQFYEDMSDTTVRRCWMHHAKLALKVHVGMSRYVQHWVEEQLTNHTPVIRGISELYFPTREELVLGYYESARGREEVVHDTAHFIERRLPRVYSRELVISKG